MPDDRLRARSLTASRARPTGRPVARRPPARLRLKAEGDQAGNPGNEAGRDPDHRDDAQAGDDRSPAATSAATAIAPVRPTPTDVAPATSGSSTAVAPTVATRPTVSAPTLTDASSTAGSAASGTSSAAIPSVPSTTTSAATGAAVSPDFSLGWVPLGESAVGGRITGLAVNPANPNVVLVGGDMLGVGLSVDGGRTWEADDRVLVLGDQRVHLGPVERGRGVGGNAERPVRVDGRGAHVGVAAHRDADGRLSVQRADPEGPRGRDEHCSICSRSAGTSGSSSRPARVP